MNTERKLPFSRKNYVLMLAGILTLMLGFTIMSLDGNLHGFGFMGITLGPIIVFIGFLIEFAAILITPDKNKPGDPLV